MFEVPKMVIDRGKDDQLKSECSSSASRSMDSFMTAMDKLRNCGWYWGPLPWEHAEMILKDKPNGSFLVRDSSDDRYIFSLSFKSSNGVHHVRINHFKGKFCFGTPESSLGCHTIVEFIEKAVEHSGDGSFRFFLHPRAGAYPAENVLLLHPVSRSTQPASLRHLCRFLILKHVRNDHIDSLPLSEPAKLYLKEPQYIVETG